ncbi:ATP-binding protein [Thermodesulfatator indicus]
MVEDAVGKLSLWKINLAFFIVLFGLLNLSFYLHHQEIEKFFVEHVRQDSYTLTEVIRLNVETGSLAEKIIKNILYHFLSNTASFLDYLDSIEPFSPDELLGFIQENGLAGVLIERQNGEILSVPEGWSPEDIKCHNNLIYIKKYNLFMFCTENLSSLKRVVIGSRVENIKPFYEKISVEGIINRISKLPNVRSVEIIPHKIDQPKVSLYKKDFKIEIPFQNKTIIVYLKAKNLELLEKKLRERYLFLSISLSFVGLILTIIFYFFQKNYLENIRDYEKSLAQQKEEVALGRAAATLAHEIKNPINNISLALQRLTKEAKNLSQEELKLLELLNKSLLQSTKTIDSLLNYVRIEKNFNKEKVELSSLILEILDRYQLSLKDKKIKLYKDLEKVFVLGNRELLLQVLENLLLNALEAIKESGIIIISLKPQDKNVILTIKNSGELPPKDKLEEIFNPYITFKTKGTGLGLALVKKIIKAHDGEVYAEITNDNIFKIEIHLPRISNEDTHS